MPKIAKEVPSGTQFSRSSNEGQLADSQTRAFRIVKNAIDEIVDIQDACDIRIGDRHPYNTSLYCVSFDARFDGDSRMVIAVTFNYQATPSAAASGSGGDDPKSRPPDIRPPNWTTSTSLIEQPVTTWGPRLFAQTWGGFLPAVNPAGDMYEGVTRLVPLVSISITVFNPNDPTEDNNLAGSVNRDEILLGSLTMSPHTLMFRGVQSQPTVESWGGLLYRGWNASYEFAYKRNPTTIAFPGDRGDPAEVDLGWDIAVPVTGFNCRAFVPGNPAADEDVFGQPLRHINGKIVPPLQLPEQTDAGDRVRAMVKVFDYEDGGTSQAPSASPIALKENGRPLKTHDANGNLVNKPLVFGYQVQPDLDFKLLGPAGNRLFR